MLKNTGCHKKQQIRSVFLLLYERIHIDSVYLTGEWSTLSSPRDGLLVICEIKTLSVYIDLPPLVEGVIPAPTDAIEVSLPSASYQDFSFFDSGISGLIFTIDLLIADNETPVINDSKNEMYQL